MVLPELAPTLVLAGLAVLVLPSVSRGDGRGRAAVMLVAVAAMLRYLIWRLTETLPPLSAAPADLWMWAMAVFEALALGNAILTALFLIRRSDRSREADLGEARLVARGSLPGVDVILPTYNEGPEILERSILGALALDWPDLRVWVLDDGRRPWLAELCRANGVRYATRQGNDNGKAGNINAWLDSGRAEAAPYLLVLDADFVPQRNLLRRVVGLFDDDTIALVQTPQSFFNPDPIQLNLLAGGAFADEQRFFYHEFQPALDAWGASFCCGTSFVVRRDRLDAVGGIPTCTVTEDMMTTYALAARGWRTVYLAEPLSVGMAPEGLAEFVSQRGRWCLGTVQALRSPAGPLRVLSLSWAHRLCFFNAQLFWLASVPLMLLAMAAPAVFWWTGTPAFLAEPGEFLSYFGPRFLAEAVAIGWVSRWSVMPLLSGIAPLVVAPAAAAAALKALFFPYGHRFRVTLKGGDRGRVVVHRSALVWLGGLMALIAAGMAAGQFPELAAPVVARANTVNIAWSGYALLLLFLAMLVCVELPRRRREERVRFDEAARLGGRPVMLIDLSLGGAQVACKGDTEVEAGPLCLQVSEVGSLPCRVVRRDRERLFLAFADLGEARAALVRKIYTGPCILPQARLSPSAAYRGAFKRGFVSRL
ncbi:MAG: glycosyltransferase [Solirubrobacterales bacterium]